VWLDTAKKDTMWWFGDLQIVLSENGFESDWSTLVRFCLDLL
jgi:hypothetical protein